MNLGELKALAQELPRIYDDRPQWLKEMPYATQPGSDYYRFIWELGKRLGAINVFEIGIDKGASTLTFASNRLANVISIDINQDACHNATAIAKREGLHGLTVQCGDSLKLAATWPETFRKQADLSLLDSWHSFDQVYQEYVLYRPFMKQGGIILFDDIRYSKEMAVAWDYIMDPKIDLSELHHSGFGACVVDHRLQPHAWELVKDEAKERYLR